MKAINGPLLVLFALSYGLGHPALATYRPPLVDRTLAAFHEDVNRSLAGTREQAARLFGLAQLAPLDPGADPGRTQPANGGAPKKPAFQELPRQQGSAFIELQGR